MKKLTWDEFTTMMYQHNVENDIRTKGVDEHPIYGIVVYKQGDWFKQEYTKKERSYRVSSDNKAFIPGQIGQSIFANCLDCVDIGVRLDLYNDYWKVDYCYMEGEK